MVTTLQTLLPADPAVIPGAVLSLHGFITVLEVTGVQNTTFTQEDHYRQVGDNTGRKR